jgi:hypothetical protein
MREKNGRGARGADGGVRQHGVYSSFPAGRSLCAPAIARLSLRERFPAAEEEAGIVIGRGLEF